MKTVKICLGLIAFAFLTSGLSIPAYADCASDIAATEIRINANPPKKVNKRQTVNRLIKEAKEALSEGKKKKCQNKLNAIKRTYGGKL